MRQDLGVNLTINDEAAAAEVKLSFKVSGETLLGWLKAKSDAKAAAAAPMAAGTDAAHPWNISGIAALVNAWGTLHNQKALWKQRECFLNIGGCTIIKLAADAEHGGVPTGTAEGFYMRDAVFSKGKDASGAPILPQDIWKKQDGASYVDFARTFQKNMLDSKKHDMTALEGQISWTQAKAAKLREILKGAKNVSAKGADSTSRALPLLAAVMFIAEPARNPRSFPIALMVLDMFGENYSRSGNKFYILDRVLSHPERIAGQTGPSAKPQSGPTGRDPVNFNMVGFGPISLKPKRGKKGVPAEPTLAAVEGKFSATPSGSARTLDTIDLRNDYIQKKEASILCRWLARTLTPANPSAKWSITLEAVRLNDTTPRIDLLTTASIANQLPVGLDKVAYDKTFVLLKGNMQNVIQAEIQKRMESLEAM